MNQESRGKIPQQEKQTQESPYSSDELKWIEEQKVEFERLKAIDDEAKKKGENTEEAKEARWKALKILRDVRKLKEEREPIKFQKEYFPDEEFEIDISKYDIVDGARIIGGKLYFFAQDADKDFITNARGIKLGEEYLDVHSPMEYKGEMVFQVDAGPGQYKLLNSKGEIIWEKDESDSIDSIISRGDDLFIFKSDDNGNLRIYDIEGKRQGYIETDIQGAYAMDMIRWGNHMIFAVGNDDEVDLFLKGNLHLGSYDKVNSLQVFQGDQLFFLARDDHENKWTGRVWKGSMDTDFKRNEYSPMKTEHADHLVVFEAGGFVVSIQERVGVSILYKGNTTKIENFSRVHEIKKIDEETIYILGIRGDKLVKEVYKLKDIEQ